MFSQISSFSHKAIRRYATVSLIYFTGSTLCTNYNEVKAAKFINNILFKTLLKKSISDNPLLTLAIADLVGTDGIENLARVVLLDATENTLSCRIITSIAWPLALADYVSINMLEMIVSDSNESPDVFIDYINNHLMGGNNESICNINNKFVEDDSEELE